MPDDKWGEMVGAFAVLRGGAGVHAGEIARFCGEKLAAYSRPKRVEFPDEIPETLYGEDGTRRPSARFWAGRDRPVG